MNFRERFLQIRDFLKPYQRIWENEIMLMYPNPLEGYPMEWVDDLIRFQNKEDVIQIEKKEVYQFITHPDLIQFYKTIEELVKLPQIQDYPPVPAEPWTWLYMIPKKQYEIKRLAPHIHHLYQAKEIKRIIDIGGGIGLLAQTLNNRYHHKITTVDMNAEFQKTGFERHEKNAVSPENKILYKNIKVEASSEFEDLLQKDVMPIGLHTCGRLAVDILRLSSKNKVPAIVNFGCCYNSLHKFEDTQNISNFAKDHDPLVMNLFALTLSARAHRKMDDKDYDLKLKVKLYRYAFHILLHDHYDIPKLVTLGNSNPKLYDEAFSVYALEQFKRVKMEPRHTAFELDAFFNNPKLIYLIQQMIAAGTIRNALGRVLELYLILDRAIYLEEQGYKVSVEEFFDEEISPRNIGITATLEC